MKAKIGLILIISFIILVTVVYAADVKWSALAANSTIADDDVLCIIDTGTATSQKITVLDFFDTIDTFAELDTIVADETLLSEEGTPTLDALWTFDLGLTITTGDPFTLGAVRWDDGSDQIDGEQIADDTIDDDSIDWSDVTFDDFDFETNWKMWYSDGSGDVTELTLGANGTFLESNGAAAAPAFRVLAAGDIPSILYNVIGDPGAAGSISFDDTETATYTTVQDTAGSFISFINSNADVSNQVYMLDLDYSVDTTQDNADFIRLQDAGSTLVVFEEEGKLTMTPSGVDDATIISIVPSVALTASDAAWYGIKIDGAALDPGDVDNIIIGVEIDLSGVDTTNNPYVEALELKMYAGGIAIHIEEGGVDHFYTAGSDAGATYAVYDIVVDGRSQAATSETHVLDIEVVNGDPDGEIVAVSTQTYVAPIHQHIGTYTIPDQAGADSEAGFFDDSATDYIDGVDGIEQFTADDDAIWISNAAVFHSLEVIMTSDATRSIIPTFWYWKDDAPDAWTEFYPLDTTEGFQHSGTISWNADDVPIWLSADVVSISAGDAGEAAEGYWIAIVRTVGADPGTPTPTTVKTGTVVLYEWDETGAIDVLSMEADTITEGGVAVINATQGGTWSGTHDFGGANLEIPQASPAVPSVDGEIEFDFTDGSLVIQHGSGHAELGSPTDVVVAKLIRCWGGTIFEPDAINDVMTIKAINSIEFPHGVVITAIYLGVSENTSYTLTVQNFDDFDTINSGSPTIDAVTYTADTTGEVIDTSPTYDTIVAGQLIMISIPSTDVDWIHFEIYYYEPAAG